MNNKVVGDLSNNTEVIRRHSKYKQLLNNWHKTNTARNNDYKNANQHFRSHETKHYSIYLFFNSYKSLEISLSLSLSLSISLSLSLSLSVHVVDSNTTDTFKHRLDKHLSSTPKLRTLRMREVYI